MGAFADAFDNHLDKTAGVVSEFAGSGWMAPLMFIPDAVEGYHGIKEVSDAGKLKKRHNESPLDSMQRRHTKDKMKREGMGNTGGAIGGSIGTVGLGLAGTGLGGGFGGLVGGTAGAIGGRKIGKGLGELFAESK